MNLAGQVEADSFTEGWGMQIARPVVDLRASPGGPRDRQLLHGTEVTVYEALKGWAFVQASDGYVGYVVEADLNDSAAATHAVGSLATHAYTEESFKSADLLHLPFGARIRVLDERRKFFETNVGFVPKKHLRPLDRPFTDPTAVAQLHFGVPYLWGGNSSLGIDCSGLVAAALTACGQSCPADSDMQRDGLGQAVDGPYERGDLLFWDGHVGMMVDGETMIHANAHHMATRYEPIDVAITRIAAQGDGDLLVRKRL
jgi:prepilin-type processing-associated H-X9-DG protein